MDRKVLSSDSAFCVGILATIALLGYVDHITGIELNFFVFYFLPVGVVAYRGGLLPSIVAAVLCAGVWGIFDIIDGHVYSSPVFAVWNTLIRLISFLIIGWLVSTIASVLANERNMSAELKKALAETKVLQGLLPICASCKKIRNDSGAWEMLERYVETRSEARFTHGLCPDCAKAMLAEAGILEKR